MKIPASFHPASKYRNIPTTVDGIRFASNAEAARYLELKLLQEHGRIRGLKLQQRLPVQINGSIVFTYIADFTYEELVSPKLSAKTKTKGEWVKVVEDVKGYRTAVYRLKAKIVKAALGITIRETSPRSRR